MLKEINDEIESLPDTHPATADLEELGLQIFDMERAIRVLTVFGTYMVRKHATLEDWRSLEKFLQ